MAARHLITMCRSSQQAPSSGVGPISHTQSTTRSVPSPPVVSPSVPSPPATSPSVVSPPIASPVVENAPKSARRKHSKVVNPSTTLNNTSNEEPVRPPKKVRGVCRRIKTTMIVNASGRIKLKYDKNVRGAEKSEIHSLLVHDIGAIVRMHSPMNKASFRELPEEDKNNLRDFLTVHYEIDFADKATSKYIDEIFIDRFKGWKHDCHNYFKEFDSADEARASPPVEFTQPDDPDRLKYWQSLCDHFTSSQFQIKSAAGRKNREKNTQNHHGGAKLFMYRWQDLREKKDSKFPAVDNFKDVYVRPNNPEATILYEKMQEKIDEFNKDNEILYPSDTPLENIPLPDPSISVKIMTDTLEELRPSSGSYVRGLGRGMERNVRSRMSPSTTQESMHSNNEVMELKEELGNSREEVKGLKEELASQSTMFDRLLAVLSAKGITSLDDLVAP